MDQAICIRQWDWSETSQTVSLFCRSHGMLRGLAKGSRRERGSFSGGIALLARGEVVAVVKPDRELQTLTQWTLLQIFRRPHDDLEANLYALSMAELVQRFLPVGAPHEALYDALLRALEHVEAGEQPAPEFLRFFFLLLRCSVGKNLGFVYSAVDLERMPPSIISSSKRFFAKSTENPPEKRERASSMTVSFRKKENTMQIIFLAFLCHNNK